MDVKGELRTVFYFSLADLNGFFLERVVSGHEAPRCSTEAVEGVGKSQGRS